MTDKQKRIAAISIIVSERENTDKVNQILSDFAEIIVGRMGIPYKERNISIITVIVDGTTDQLGALSGKLGQIKNIKVKSLVV